MAYTGLDRENDAAVSTAMVRPADRRETAQDLLAT
jgi:hypothetical protein